MDLNKPKANSSELQPIEYEVIIAFFLLDAVLRIWHSGDKNRLFVELYGGVLELDTSTTKFTTVKTFNTGLAKILCYVPDPHQLLVVRDGKNEVRAVSCDDNTVVWRVQREGGLDPGLWLYIPCRETILVDDWRKKRVVVLHPGTGSEIKSISLPHIMQFFQMCLFSRPWASTSWRVPFRPLPWPFFES